MANIFVVAVAGFIYVTNTALCSRQLRRCLVDYVSHSMTRVPAGS